MSNVNNEPVTVIISRRVNKENAAAFEALSTEMTHRARQFDGHISTAMFKPSSPEDPEYRIIFRFEDREKLKVWEESNERAEIIEQIEALLISPSEREVVDGLVMWFEMPSKNPLTPPPKYKMTIVSWLALYPTVTVIFLLFGGLIHDWPLLARTAFITVIVMYLMSYVLMPFMTKRFAFWLFPKRK